MRGIACLLLVGFHVVGANAQLGLNVAEGPVRWLNDGLAYLRMPLFTFLSGWVYGARPCAGPWRRFMLRKAQRLLVPMLVVGTAFVALQQMVDGTNLDTGPWYLMHLRPVAHFWFSEALLWVFLAMCLLERQSCLRAPGPSLLVLAAASTAYLACRAPVWLGLNDALYLMPYFLVGMMVSRFKLMPLLLRADVRLGLAAVALAAVVSMGMPVPDPNRRTVPMLVAGITLCLLALGAEQSQPWLARLGAYSYSIFIFHVFFTAASRIALTGMGLDVLFITIPCGLLAGMAGPCLLEELLKAYKYPAFLLLGRVPAEGKPAATAAAHAGKSA